MAQSASPQPPVTPLSPITHGGSGRTVYPLRIMAIVLVISLLPSILSMCGVDFSLSLPSADVHSLLGRRNTEMLQLMYEVMDTAFANTLLAWTAFCLALVTACLAVFHFYVSRDVATPVIGMAFICVAIMEGVYTLFSAQLLQSVVGLETMVPVLWTSARFFHALIMLVGVGAFLWKGSRRWDGRIGVVFGAYVVFATLTCLMIQVVSTAQNLPQFIFKDNAVPHPYDLIPLAMYLFAGLFVYPRFHRKMGSTFSLALMVSVIPDSITQIHMAFFSHALFDSHFVIACMLKIVAYAIPFGGLMWDDMRTHRLIKENVEQLEAEVQERARAERQLEESEKQLHDFLDNSGDLIQIVAPDGALQFVNHTWKETLGYEDKDLAGLTFEQVFAPDCREEAAAIFKEALAGNNLGDLMFTLLARDGHAVRVQGTTNCLFKQGRPVSVHVSFRDITDRERAIEDLRETQGELDRFFSLSIDMLGILGYDGLFKRLSPAWTEALGYDQKALVSRPCIDFVHPEDRVHFAEAVDKLLSGSQRLSFEARMVCQDGTVKWFSWAACPYPSRRLIYAGARDDSDRKRFENELINAKLEADEANQSKSAFLASMSHEIRTPLNAIIGMSDLLSESELSTDQGKYVEVLRTSGNSLLNLINDILDLSKVEAGQLEIEAIVFDLHDLIEKVCQMLSMRALEKDVEMLLFIEREVPTHVVGDPTRLRQILVNLLGNAVKFTEKGEVFLRVQLLDSTQEGCQLKFTVSDTGIGIPADRLDRVFESFAQASSSVARRYGGTGLGLAISKRLVTLMGGTIGVRSTLGQGTDFHFTIQLGRVDGDRTIKFMAAPRMLPDKRAAVIDSNPTSLQITQALLGELQMESDLFDDLETGLQRLAAAREAGTPYDVVIIDVGRAALLGLGAVGRVRKGDLVANIVVSVPYQRLHEVKASLRRHASVVYLVKPVHRAEFYRAVGGIFGEPRHTAKIPRSVASTAAPQAAAPVEVDLSAMRILLAEDSEDNQTLFRFYLKDKVQTLDIAGNGLEALQLYEHNTYDLILMDIEMPEMNGLEAVKRIREIEAEREQAGRADQEPVPIITLTAHAMNTDREKCLQAGFNGYLTKPIRKAELLRAIAEHYQPQA